MKHRTLLAAVTAIAVFFAMVGWFVGRTITSPEDAAAQKSAPVASLITVPVEKKTLSQSVVVRGTLEASESSDITISAGDLTAIITATPKEVGDQLKEGDVAIEVVGRPVITLEGVLPAFRDLGPEVEGPDVKQLETSLQRLGLRPGTVDEIYDSATAQAVVALYKRAGYVAPKVSTEATQAVISATQNVEENEEGVRLAKKALTDAQNSSSLATVSFHVSDSENKILTEEPQLPEQDESEDESLNEPEAVPDLDQLQRDVTAAQRALTQAKADLATAQSSALVRLPASEVQFFAALPQKVQSVNVDVGDTATDSAMSISGSALTITSGVSASDKKLLTVDDIATVTEDSLGVTLEAKIVSIADTATENGRFIVKLEPIGKIPDEAVGQNMKVEIPIVSSGGEVLAVPLAALSSTGSGNVRVEVERGEGVIETVTVKPGLKAEGFVQVNVLEGSLQEGDRLVVGRDLVLPGEKNSDEDTSEDSE